VNLVAALAVAPVDAPVWYAVAFLVALGLALYFTPILRDTALRAGIVDAPDGRLKQQRAPVAYLGGLAIYLSFLVTLCVTPLDSSMVGLLLAATLVLLLGLIDDLNAMTPTVKLLGQLLAAFVLIKTGVRIEIALLGELSTVFTILWIVAITNAFNIIDVHDGLSSGVAFVVLLFLFVIAVLNGDVTTALFAIALAGAILGFLRSNFAPASIYLGDAGSMLIGFMTGALAMRSAYADHNRLAVVAPLLLLAVPLFDTALVTVLRLRQGRSPFRGSPDHFAVRLRRAGVSDRAIALGAYAVTALCGGAALWLMRLDRAGSLVLLAGLGLAFVFAALVIANVGGANARPADAAARDKADAEAAGS
jgi:UDP-GlcNAc:undecaprenyl-phosphate GlcNAc-1-phosphate transferase